MQPDSFPLDPHFLLLETFNHVVETLLEHRDRNPMDI